jgi:hypothetical protein
MLLKCSFHRWCLARQILQTKLGRGRLELSGSRLPKWAVRRQRQRRRGYQLADHRPAQSGRLENNPSARTFYVYVRSPLLTLAGMFSSYLNPQDLRERANAQCRPLVLKTALAVVNTTLGTPEALVSHRISVV